MNDFSEDVSRHRKFDAVLKDPDACAAKLKAMRATAPGSIPYALWVDARYPGRFALTYRRPSGDLTRWV